MTENIFGIFEMEKYSHEKIQNEYGFESDNILYYFLNEK